MAKEKKSAAEIKKILLETQKKMRASKDQHARPAKSSGNWMQAQTDRRKKKTETPAPIDSLPARVKKALNKQTEAAKSQLSADQYKRLNRKGPRRMGVRNN